MIYFKFGEDYTSYNYNKLRDYLIPTRGHREVFPRTLIDLDGDPQRIITTQEFVSPGIYITERDMTTIRGELEMTRDDTIRRWQDAGLLNDRV